MTCYVTHQEKVCGEGHAMLHTRRRYVVQDMLCYTPGEGMWCRTCYVTHKEKVCGAGHAMLHTRRRYVVKDMLCYTPQHQNNLTFTGSVNFGHDCISGAILYYYNDYKGYDYNIVSRVAVTVLQFPMFRTY